MFEYTDTSIVAGSYELTIYRRSDTILSDDLDFASINEKIITLRKESKNSAPNAIHNFLEELVLDIPGCYKATIKQLSGLGKSITYTETDKLPSHNEAMESEDDT